MSDGSITIPKEVHERALLNLGKEYEQTFGFDPLSEGAKETKRLIGKETYERNLLFWKTRLPTVGASSPPPDMETIARHAICSNAISNMERELKKYKGGK